MEFKRIISAKDSAGRDTDFGIIWETVFMTCTFSLGINLKFSNFLTFFYVSNDGIKDNYQLLKYFYIPAYVNGAFPVDSIMNAIKLAMADKVSNILTARCKVGLITIEQIKKWKENL